MEISSLTRSDINTLADLPAAPSVSLYMPTHRTGPETRQDPIRLRNLIEAADQQLESRGCSNEVRQSVLAPAREIPDQVAAEFWENGSDGLALLLREGTARCYKVPTTLPEVALASKRFLISPLLAYLQTDGHFFVLAVSQNHVRLMSGSKDGLAELQLESLPTSLAEALNIDEYQSSLQFHSHTTVQESAPEGGEAIYHGHGGGEGDDRKAEILQYFQRLNRPLMSFLADDDSPLVFAGVEYLFPLFKQAFDYKRLVDKPVSGNPDGLSVQELHAPAWALVEPTFRASRDEAIAKYGFASSRDLATDDRAAIHSALEEGRVETLLIAETSVQQIGRDSDGSGIEDLEELSTLSEMTLRTSATVYVIPPDQMPTQAPVAAILRY